MGTDSRMIVINDENILPKIVINDENRLPKIVINNDNIFPKIVINDWNRFPKIVINDENRFPKIVITNDNIFPKIVIKILIVSHLGCDEIYKSLIFLHFHKRFPTTKSSSQLIQCFTQDGKAFF